jgi:NarL family two-component system response regulator LiaR
LRGARVLVVDDDELTCRMLDRVLTKAACTPVIARGQKEVEDILATNTDRFDAAVVDLRLRDTRGGTIVALLRTLDPPCSALMITGFDDRKAAHESIAAGADDFLLKPFTAEQFLTAVADTIEKTARWRERIEVEPTRSAEADAKSKEKPSRASRPRSKPEPISTATLGVLNLEQCTDELVARGNLTLREREIVKLLLVGRTNKEIADKIGATERTAKFHVSNILDKLGMNSRSELLRFFF